MKRNKRKQRGITLIALIISIIVMLILVGVTVTVSLNGGLFKKSKTATINTQIEAEKEQLLSAVIGAIGENADVKFNELDNNLPNGWTGTDGTYTSPSEHTFIVNKDGTIMDETEVWKDNGNGTYTKGEQTVTVGQTTFTNNEVLEKLGITESTGTYKGEWTVIGAEGNKLKLVSKESVGSQMLGYKDPGAIAAITAVDEESPTHEEILERARWSYKNVVYTLDTKAKEATGIESARSIKIEDIYDIIGEENVNKGTEYGTKWNYYYENGYVYSKYQTGTNESGKIIWSEPYKTSYSSQTFVNEEGKTVVVDSVNDNVTVTCTYYKYNLTDKQKSLIGNFASGGFLLAMPVIDCNKEGVSYKLEYLEYGVIGDYPFEFTRTYSISNGYTIMNGRVSAVVSVSVL